MKNKPITRYIKLDTLAQCMAIRLIAKNVVEPHMRTHATEVIKEYLIERLAIPDKNKDYDNTKIYTFLEQDDE